MDQTDLLDPTYLYGTAEPADQLRRLQLGRLSLIYTPEGLRRITWDSVELVRAIAWPIRDENWGTYAPLLISEVVDETADSLNARLEFSVADGALHCVLRIQASAAGSLECDLAMTATGAGFATNRAGFTVLHPIKGVAGAPLMVRHSGGASETTVFPLLISPDQPVMDIAGLAYEVGGAVVDIAFAGEVFEMEDQRNWTDASYKTYCVPLVYPFTYEISAGQTVSQSIRVTLSGDGEQAAQAQDEAPIVWQNSDEAAPQIGLALEPGWFGSHSSAGIAAQSGVGHLVARIEPGATAQDLDAIVGLQSHLGCPCETEIIIADDADPAVALEDIAARLRAHGIAPTHVTALRAGYLGSHQPSGPWPEGPTPAEVAAAARLVFPDARIGAGMLTNFTEVNRCRPDAQACDYITHGTTAIVHAGDDLSVLETLECLPQVLNSARALSEGKPYRLGLVSIGMRSNPYGAAVAENPMQVRRTMAREDPRHRGLFGAAWAVGALTATAGHAVSSICLAAPEGPFGLAYAPQAYPQAYFDDHPGAVIYPLFHVFKAASEMAGHPRLTLTNLAEGIACYGVRSPGHRRMMLANTTPYAQTVSLPEPANCAVMDATSFDQATASTDWLEMTQKTPHTDLALTPFAVAFLEWGD